MELIIVKSENYKKKVKKAFILVIIKIKQIVFGW